MRLVLTIFVLSLITFKAQCQLEGIPQLSTIEVPLVLWNILLWLIKFQEPDDNTQVKQPFFVAQTLDGPWAIDKDGQLWTYTLANAGEEAKGPIWAENEDVADVDMQGVAPSLLPSTYLYIADTYPYLSLEGVVTELAFPSESACLLLLRANILMSMIAIDCDGELAVLDLEDIPSGWVPFTNAPPGTLVDVSIDSLGTIWVANDDGEVYFGTDADGWTLMEVEDGYSCGSVAVTIEGAVWLACEEDKNNKIVASQLKVGHAQLHFFKKDETDLIAGFHIAQSSIITNKAVLYSDIFGLNQFISKKLAEFIDQAMGGMEDFEGV